MNKNNVKSICKELLLFLVQIAFSRVQFGQVFSIGFAFAMSRVFFCGSLFIVASEYVLSNLFLVGDFYLFASLAVSDSLGFS